MESWGWFINATWRKWVASHNPPNSQKPPFEETLACDAFMAILGTRWIKPAITAWKQALKRPMVKGKGFLIKTDDFENEPPHINKSSPS